MTKQKPRLSFWRILNMRQKLNHQFGGLITEQLTMASEEVLVTEYKRVLERECKVNNELNSPDGRGLVPF